MINCTSAVPSGKDVIANGVTVTLPTSIHVALGAGNAGAAPARLVTAIHIGSPADAAAVAVTKNSVPPGPAPSAAAVITGGGASTCIRTGLGPVPSGSVNCTTCGPNANPAGTVAVSRPSPFTPYVVGTPPIVSVQP